MLTAAAIIMCISLAVIAWACGYLYGANQFEEKTSARVIRPSEIKVERHYHVTEYTVEPGALDIDFPDTKGGINEEP